VKPCLKKQKEREGERDQVFNRGTLWKMKTREMVQLFIFTEWNSAILNF
jgi:hypothetical protein